MFLCAVYIYGMVIRMISPMIDKSPLDGDAEERDGERGWLRMIPGFGYNGYCRGELSEYKILVTGHSLGWSSTISHIHINLIHKQTKT